MSVTFRPECCTDWTDHLQLSNWSALDIADEAGLVFETDDGLVGSMDAMEFAAGILKARIVHKGDWRYDALLEVASRALRTGKRVCWS